MDEQKQCFKKYNRLKAITKSLNDLFKSQGIITPFIKPNHTDSNNNPPQINHHKLHQMYKKPTRSQTLPVKKPPSRSNDSQQQPPTQQPRPKYVPPISKDRRNQTATKQSQFKSRDQQVLSIVKEYLSSHGYTRTVETLRRERPMTKVGVVNSSMNNNRRRESVGSVQQQQQGGNSVAKNQQEERNIMKWFQRGQRDEFFKNTLKWFNPNDHNAAKLQFQLQVYFCTYSVHPSINKSQTIEKSSLEAFKKYLQNRGSQLASEQRYITFFSLPYISKPHQNPSFSYLFTKEYLTKLKQKLTEFVHEHFQQLQRESKMGFNNQGNGVGQKEKKCCQLEDIYDAWVEMRGANEKESQNETLNSRARETKEIKDFKSFKESPQYRQVQQQIRKLKSKLDEANEHRQYALNYVEKLSSNIKQLAESSKANLLESNKKWFLFAKDIIVMVRKAMKQQGFKIEGFDKFEGFFGKNIDEVINNADISIFDKQSMMVDDYSMVGGNNGSKNINDRSNLGGNGQRQRQQTSSQLDMVKIQSLFANAEDPERQMQILLLLKALKNRFSKLKNPYAKREVIVQYSRHDICGVTPQKLYIQKKLLVDGSQKIREFYLRLTNDIAFDLYGIHYLTKSDKLIENLIKVLEQEILQETASKRFVLAILQRFSYPIKSRKKMVELGIVPLIFKVLQSQHEAPSIYTLQYLTAMIMNLSLKKDCQKHFSPYKQQLMSMMIDLMCHQSEQIRNYVNGAVYLLLSYKQLQQQAKKQHLEERIMQMLQSEAPQISQQQSTRSHPTTEHSIERLDQDPLQQDEQEQGQSSLQVQYNYILKKIRGQIEIDSDESDEQEDEGVQIDEFQQQDDNDDADEDNDGQDDDQSEYIDGEDECIAGEQLLLKEYTLLGPQALKEQLLTRSVLDETARKINNTTLSMNRSKRLDNIFVQKDKGSQGLILQPEFDKLLGQENFSREDLVVKKKR